jgi:hypothetical protein
VTEIVITFIANVSGSIQGGTRGLHFNAKLDRYKDRLVGSGWVIEWVDGWVGGWVDG